MLFTLFFNQSSSRTLFLPDPRSYLLLPTVSSCHSYSERDIQTGKRSADPSPVHALSLWFSDVSTSCLALGAKDITAVL